MTATEEWTPQTRRRNMRGIPQLTVSFDIPTHVHRQAVLVDPGGGVSFGQSTRNLSYDAVNRVWSNSHLYRASVTLAGDAR